MRSSAAAIGALVGAGAGALAGGVEVWSLAGTLAVLPSDLPRMAIFVDGGIGLVLGAVAGGLLGLQSRVLGAVGAGLLGAGLLGAWAVSAPSDRVVSELGKVPPSTVANVLVVMMDRLPAERFGDGTPELDALGEGALRLHRVMVPSPDPEQTRAVVLSGRYAAGVEAGEATAMASALAWQGFQSAVVLVGNDRATADVAGGFGALRIVEPAAGSFPPSARWLAAPRALAAWTGATPEAPSLSGIVEAASEELLSFEGDRPWALLVDLRGAGDLTAFDAAVGDLVEKAEDRAGARGLTVAVGGLRGGAALDGAPAVSAATLDTAWVLRGARVLEGDVDLPLPVVLLPSLVLASASDQVPEVLDASSSWMDARRVATLFRAAAEGRYATFAGHDWCLSRPSTDLDVGLLVSHATERGTIAGYRRGGWLALRDEQGEVSLYDTVVDPFGARDLLAEQADVCGTPAAERAAAWLALHDDAMAESAAGKERVVPTFDAFVDDSIYPDPLAHPWP